MKQTDFDVAIVGSGSTGIATAYYLALNHGISNVALIDCAQPMAFTSAQSGENYRNWWPHCAMVDFTNRSIDLMEEIAIATNNRINMNRRGYALATRESDVDDLITQLQDGLGEQADELIRFHQNAAATGYQPPANSAWQGVKAGVDVLRNQDLIRATFPSYAHDIKTVVHIRRGGDISAQQLGMYMLEYISEKGIKRVKGLVRDIDNGVQFSLEIQDGDATRHLTANKIINAAGPFAGDIAGMLNVSLPLHNTFQQKIAFDDRQRVIPRDMPFSIDLDGQRIDWLDEERDLLQEHQDYKWLAQPMPGSIHCRPDGGDGGSWVKLGWAYNQQPAQASWELALDDHFPDVVLRGAARLNPALKCYYGQLPRSLHHYGGWYTLTDENWPLIGPMGIDGAFMNCALSGFGSMAACAGGELCAAWATDAALPSYAKGFSLKRYDDKALMQQLQACNRGIL